MQRTKSHSALLAKRNGENFERLIEMTCAYYSKMGVAYIQKTPEPMKVIAVLDKVKGHFRAHYEKKAQPDFTGTLKSGKSVVFEAKHTEGTNIPFKRIIEEQERDLRLHDHLGAVAFVLISFKMKHFYAVPYKDWIHMKETSGKKSVNQDDLAKYQVSTDRGYLSILEGLE
ncbi:Holliday junction resolvase RecU [Marinilactibacillus sp. Marseille-P9653]|uniref:Holliday junction resolvase RecU n=1 Tax=Marinilactibacillus sp. Marseille-P9653 TaxID=2866583 RepID=UPI001CE3DBCD|nr:Holliday junction resolvase RecU [Marinilactibacillus sp. Marseille-P9653]